MRVAGDAFDDAIIQHLKRRHEVLIGERTAETIKLQIGSATKMDKPIVNGGQGTSPREGRSGEGDRL